MSELQITLESLEFNKLGFSEMVGKKLIKTNQLPLTASISDSTWCPGEVECEYIGSLYKISTVKRKKKIKSSIFWDRLFWKEIVRQVLKPNHVRIPWELKRHTVENIHKGLRTSHSTEVFIFQYWIKHKFKLYNSTFSDLNSTVT